METMNGTTTKKIKRHKRHKALKIIGFSLLGLIIVIIAAVGILFHGEIATVASIHRVDNTDLFTMEYKGDYGLDDLLKQGVSTDADLVAFMSRRLLKGIPLNFDLPDLSCSTFMAKTPDGDVIFGRNFDNADTPVLILTTRPKDGYASISTVNLAFIGYSNREGYLPDKLTNDILVMAAPYAPLDGVNEKGVSIGVLQLDGPPTRQDTGKVPITTTAAIRLILDKAATVDEALDLLRQYDMCSSANAPYHFQIADATGRSVIVEYIDNMFTVVDGLCATNFVLAQGPDYNVGGGQDRYAALQQTLTNSNDVLTQDQGMRLLQDVHQHDNDTPTQWSVVYDNTKLTEQFCLHMNYDNPYTFTLKP